MKHKHKWQFAGFFYVKKYKEFRGVKNSPLDNIIYRQIKRFDSYFLENSKLCFVCECGKVKWAKTK